jgi:ATP-dependent Clp protease ATP-binding subunit ClpA
VKVSLVLFDEIEKASDSLWQLLLGILDKATLTLGDNRRVDFSHTMVIMTSNLGAREMSELISGGIGFAPGKGAKQVNDTEVDQKIYRTAVEAARRKFSPEFMNRIDKVVVFRSLKEHHLRLILDLELQAVQDRIMASADQGCFPVFRRRQGYAAARRPGSQVWRPSLEARGGAFSRLSAFQPGSHGASWAW